MARTLATAFQRPALSLRGDRVSGRPMAARRLAIAAATLIGYVIVFVAVYPRTGSVIAALSVLPVIAVAWSFGLRAGLVAGFSAVAINGVLHMSVGEPWWTVVGPRGATGSFVVVIVGILSGHVQESRRSLALELGRRAEAEREARSAAARTRAILDAAVDAMVVSDESGVIRDANEAALRVFDRSRDQLIGMDLESILQSTAGPNSEIAARGLRPDGGQFPAETSIAPIGHSADAGFVTTVRDISQRIAVEQSMRQGQRMEAVGQLAGGIAHDFNNLLTAIGGYANLLLTELDPADERRANAVEIRNASDRAASLTRQLLEFSRRQHIQAESVDLNEVVRGLEPMIRRVIGEHVLVVTYLDSAIDEVHIDRSQLEQVVVNLAINGRDAMEDGGVLTIATGLVNVSADGYPEPRRMVRLTVADTGTGMDEAVRARIFEPFFTTKETGKGTGLGLSSVHGIVRSAGGEIEVTSQVGEGSVFFVLLPSNGRQPSPDVMVNAPIVAPGGSELILLVEDEPAVRRLAARFLRDRGYEVREASSMPDALDAFETSGRPFDALVTDVVMPGGGGRELARRILLQCADLPVLFLSGYPHIGQPDQRGEVPGPLLSKPFTADQLAMNLRAVLDRRALQDAAGG